MAPLHHLSLGVADLDRAGRFYDAALAPLGWVRVWTVATGIGYGPPGGGDKLALKLRPLREPHADDGFHAALAAPTREAAAAFHAAALAHGGRDNGAPALRPHYGEHYFAAFVFDPDGHPLEAVINTPPEADLCATLAALEAEIHHPGRPCTAARMHELLHPDFHEIGRSGAPYSRAQVVQYLLGRTAIPEVRAVHHQVEVVSGTHALLLFDTDEPGPAGTRVRAAKRSSLWQRTGDKWQLRFHHATPVDAIGLL
jgi:catechol 2,3-dioxygenase-like lactoylglutathione lyase family enzyme